MICALTVRKLNMLRNAENPDEVITFGFFDGSAEQLREIASKEGYEDQLSAIAPFVESTGADGLYEVVEDRTP